MNHSRHNKDEPRAREERATQTDVDSDSTLVKGLVFGIRLFFVLFAAFARAMVIVAENDTPNNLFVQVLRDALSGTSTSAAHPSRNIIGSLGARTTTLLQAYYVIFIGREVGYMTSSTLATSLVQGIPHNFSQKFNSFAEAIRAYSESALHGNVRRVRTSVKPSGHVEFIYEFIGISAGIRNLDAPHLPSQPLTPVTEPPNPPPPPPCNSVASADLCDVATGSSVSSATSISRSDDLVIPVGSSTVSNPEASADTAIITAATTMTSPTINASGVPGSFTVFLDSDEDSSDSSIVANNTISTVSAHSSDIYYVDKAYDVAFAAYIEDEDNKVANGESSSGVVAVE